MKQKNKEKKIVLSENLAILKVPIIKIIYEITAMPIIFEKI
jgi:hypothetical protein